MNCFSLEGGIELQPLICSALSHQKQSGAEIIGDDMSPTRIHLRHYVAIFQHMIL